MTDDYNEMLIKINEIINALRDHECEHEQCCVRQLLQEIEFNE